GSESLIYFVYTLLRIALMVDVKKDKELLRKIIREEYDKPGAAARAKKIAFPLLPNKLFKFRGITNGALDNFESDTLFCAKPKTFYDPFDCGLNFKVPDERALLSTALVQIGLSTPARLELIRKAPDVYAAFADIASELKGSAEVTDNSELAMMIQSLLDDPYKLSGSPKNI
ncbi:hypothetical protein, partial [Pseudomonas savastanoi]|uniref:hypothetical protein n=1 Tax=Pseudomonas savastanoi TaxID=29438 RepID=UPI001F3A8F00